MKEQIKTPEKIQLSDKETANLSDAEFKTLVIKTGNQDAHKNGWVWSQNRGKSEGDESELKENAPGNNSEGKETGTQINSLDQKE